MCCAVRLSYVLLLLCNALNISKHIKHTHTARCLYFLLEMIHALSNAYSSFSSTISRSFCNIFNILLTWFSSTTIINQFYLLRLIMYLPLLLSFFRASLCVVYLLNDHSVLCAYVYVCVSQCILYATLALCIRQKILSFVSLLHYVSCLNIQAFLSNVFTGKLLCVL